jgi:hypothetical protein
LAAEALVLGLQVVEASLKGLAAGTRDGLHTPIIGEARAASALPRPQCGDQLALDALNNYRPSCWPPFQGGPLTFLVMDSAESFRRRLCDRPKPLFAESRPSTG